MISRHRARAFPRPTRLVVGVLLSVISWAAFGYGVYATVMGYQHRSEVTTAATIHPEWGRQVLLMLAIFLLAQGLSWWHGQVVKCPLCHGTPLAAGQCRLHRDSIRIWPLTRRASVVACLLMMGRFVCMHCGTAFRWKK
jgi:hypothetical protein